MPHNSPDMPERVSRLETSVEALHSDVGDLKRTMSTGFAEIQQGLTRSRETNWPLIVSFIMLIGSVYAAAIAPLKSEIIRQEKERTTLAEAVLRKEEQIADLRIIGAASGKDISELQSTVRSLTEKGSPIISTRLSLIEQQLRTQNP